MVYVLTVHVLNSHQLTDHVSGSTAFKEYVETDTCGFCGTENVDFADLPFSLLKRILLSLENVFIIIEQNYLFLNFFFSFSPLILFHFFKNYSNLGEKKTVKHNVFPLVTRASQMNLGRFSMNCTANFDSFPGF